MRTLKSATTLVLALALLTGMSGVARAEVLGESAFYLAADNVLVNKAGGITVSGTLDCTAAIEEAYGSSTIPEDFAVFVPVNWEATQYVGRNKVVTAKWESAIAFACYGSIPGAGTWQTRYPFPSGAIQWVYSSSGKFQTGTIHIEVWSVGSEVSVGDDTWLISAWSGSDLKAVKTTAK